MKKTLFILLLSVVITSALCSCGKQTENDPGAASSSVSKTVEESTPEENSIVGIWSAEMYGKKSSFSFNEDGTGLAINNQGTEIPFSYTIISDTKLSLIYIIDGEEVAQESQYALNGDKLMLDEVEFTRQ